MKKVDNHCSKALDFNKEPLRFINYRGVPRWEVLGPPPQTNALSKGDIRIKDDLRA